MAFYADEKKEIIKAVDYFTDREDPQKSFWKLLNSMKSGQIEVINYYGDGGNGKTTLLRKLQKEIIEKSKTQKLECIYYNFEGNDSKIDFLYILSRQMMSRNKKIKFTVYDYAFEMYHHKMGKPQSEIDAYVKKMEKTILEYENIGDLVTESLGEMTGEELPFGGFLKFAVKGAIKFYGEKTRLSELKKPENINYYTEISTSTPNQIINNMQKYFVHDIKSYFEDEDRKFIIMLDGYECLVNQLKFGDLVSIKDKWLYDGIIKYVPNVFWVIAGRQKLLWGEEFFTTKDNQHLLGYVSSGDTETYFRKVGICDDTLIEGLCKMTNGTPIYMDWCYKRYLQIIGQKGEGYVPSLKEIGTDTSDLVEKYLRDIENVRHQKIIYMMSMLPKNWDDEMALWVADYAGYKDIKAEYDTIKSLSHIEKIGDTYKLQETFRKVVIQFIAKNTETVKERDCFASAVWAYYFSYIESETDEYKRFKLLEKYLDPIIWKYITLSEEQYDKIFNEFKFIDYWLDQRQVIKKVKEFLNNLIEKEVPDKVVFRAEILKSYYENRYIAEESEEKLEERVENAKKLFERVEHIVEESDSLYIEAKKNWADTCFHTLMSDKIRFSNQLRKEIYMMCKKHFDELDDRVITSLDDCLESTENIEERIGILTEVYELKMKKYGEDSRKAIAAFQNIAFAYNYPWDIDKKIKKLEEAHEMSINFLGKAHELTLSIKNNLAYNYLERAYAFESKSQDVIELYKDTDEIYEKVYGELHPEIYAKLRNQKLAYMDLGEDELAQKHAKDLCERLKKAGRWDLLLMEQLDSEGGY